MSGTILTQVKGISNMLARLLTIPRFWGPLLTIIFTVIYHVAAVRFGFSITFSWLWLFMVAGVFIGGLRAGLLCAAFTVVYAVYALPMDMSRLIQLAINTPAAAALIGWQTRTLRRSLAEAHEARIEAEKSVVAIKAAMERADRNEAAAQALDALNGNILRIRQTRKTLLDLLEKHPLDEPTRDEIRLALHMLNNLELATAGWKALDKLKANLDARMGEGDVSLS